MQKIMQNNAAVFRTGEVLQEGCDQIAATAAKIGDLHVSDET
ncbi:hypothetical protein, partial [Marinicella rhabdoformis]